MNQHFPPHEGMGLPQDQPLIAGQPVPHGQPLPPQQQALLRDVVDDNWGRFQPPPAPLILMEQPVSVAGRLPVQPGRALLFSDDAGQVYLMARPPGLFAMRRYRWRYEVDLSDHYTAIRLEVPSKSKATRFRLTIDAGWRVTRPEQIVTARISDGNAIVRSWILESVLPICRGYEIEEDGPLERHLTESLGHGRVHEYPEGISLFRFSAQVNHDRRAAGWIAQRVDAGHQARNAEEGIARLRKQISTEEDLILLLLQRAPDRVGDVINDIRKRREMSMQSRIELFNKMVDNDLIQEAEMETIRQMIIQPIEGMISSRPTGMFGIERAAPVEQPAAIARPEEDEDPLPSQIMEGTVDNVTGWNPAPWQRQNGTRSDAPPAP